MLATQSIRRHADGSIDYGHYKTEAVRLRGQAMRDALKPRATFKMFAAATAIGIALLAGIAGPHVVGSPVVPATSSAMQAAWLERTREAGRAGTHAALVQDANAIRQRIVALSNSDPRRRWDSYGKSTNRGRHAAIAELKRQGAKTQTQMARASVTVARSQDEANAELQGRIARSRVGHAEALLRSRAWWESFGQRRHGIGTLAAAD